METDDDITTSLLFTDQVIHPEETSSNGINGKEPEKPQERVTDKELKERTQSIVDPAHIDIGFPIKQLRFRREIKLKCLMLLLFCIIITGVICIYQFFEPENLYFGFGETKFDVETHTFEIRYNEKTVLVGDLGQQISKDVNPYYCQSSDMEICLRWMNIGSLKIQQSLIGSTEIYHVTWVAWKQSQQLLDCYSFGDYSWYGGGILTDQMWPIQYWNKSQTPFITSFVSSGNNYGHEGFGSVQERYWLSSSGIAIIINSTTPLFVSIFNKSQICFKSVFSNPYVQMTNEPLELQYSIIVDKSISSVDKYAKATVFPKPKIKHEELFGGVIWSLEDIVHRDCLTQSDVLNYANDVISHGYNASILEIPEGFSSRYGDFNFDPQRFSNATEMLEILHDKGWKVVLVTGIFANTDAQAFVEGISNDFWVKDPRGEVPGLVQWDFGIGALLDVTYDAAVTWFVNRVNDFRRKYNIDYFTFKYGQASYLPYGFRTKLPLNNPSDFTRLYAEAITQVEGSIATTSNYRNQDLGLYTQLEPLNSTWLPTNGLKSVIPSIFNLAILGYPYFIPNTIGGTRHVQKNCNQSDVLFHNDTELYVRWLEMQTFFPIMKFSLPPWKLADSVDNIAKQWVAFHENVIKNKYLEQFESFDETLTLIQPLWLAENIQNIDSKVFETSFMIGNSIIVAPIVDANATTRKIYLPKGKWTSPLGSEIIQGGETITITDINIDSILYFELVNEQ